MEDDLVRLGKVMAAMEKYPTVYLKGIIGSASQKILLQARLNAATRMKVRSGNLLSAINAKSERTRSTGKVVVQLGFLLSSMEKLTKRGVGNKLNKHGQAKTQEYYYPMLQEYGWQDENKNYTVKGKRFMRDAMDMNANDFTETVIEQMMDKFGNAWRNK